MHADDRHLLETVAKTHLGRDDILVLHFAPEVTPAERRLVFERAGTVIRERIPTWRGVLLGAGEEGLTDVEVLSTDQAERLYAALRQRLGKDR